MGVSPFKHPLLLTAVPRILKDLQHLHIPELCCGTSQPQLSSAHLFSPLGALSGHLEMTLSVLLLAHLAPKPRQAGAQSS